MNKGLLIAGGIFNAFFTLFHIFMGWQIQMVPTLTEDVRALLQMLNVGVVLIVSFAAYVSFFHKSELVETRLGKSLLVLIALFYTARAVGEIILSPAFSPVIFGICLIVAGVYLAAAFRRVWVPARA